MCTNSNSSSNPVGIRNGYPTDVTPVSIPNGNHTESSNTSNVFLAVNRVVTNRI